MKPNTAPAPIWSTLRLPDTLARLRVDASQGLIAADVEARAQRYGSNALHGRTGQGDRRILVNQLGALPAVILLLAALTAAVAGSFREAAAMVAVVALNALLGVVQARRAGRTLAALRGVAGPDVRVRREGQTQSVAAAQLVPGDIVLLEAGRPAPADGRLIEVAGLRMREAILTGEPAPVEKITAAIPGPDVALSYQRNMVFMGTTVVSGRGRMVVTETGMRTQLGRAAGALQEITAPRTPSQRRLARLGRDLALVTCLLVGLIAGIGALRGAAPGPTMMTAVSMAVAVVPAALPVVMTLALALGARRMFKRRARIHTLQAVETLGAVTVICADKTGVLTENQARIAACDLTGRRVDLTETYHNREPVILPDEPALPVDGEHAPLGLLLGACALCNNASLRPDPGLPGHFHAPGDPAEGALVVAAARGGLWKAALDAALPRLAEFPFDAERGRMTTVHQVIRGAGANTPLAPFLARQFPLLPDFWIAFTKGSVAGLAEISESVWVEDHPEPLDAVWRARLAAIHDELTGQGLRVIGVAFRAIAPERDAFAETAPQPPSGLDLERGMILVGLVGLFDPPRPAVPAAVAACHAAGIRPVLLTGDAPLAAGQIAAALGISAGGRILTGSEIARMTPAALRGVIEDVSVFARVGPEHKLGIVQALQSRGHIVALTGDSLDDAPALKAADAGASLGIAGTDVSRAAAALTLGDDHFGTLLAAIEAGRGVADRIRKFIGFALAGNLGKVLVVLIAPLLGLPLPLNPLQLLAMNLVGDGVLGIGLSAAQDGRDTLRRPPDRHTQGLFSRGLGLHVLGGGILIGAIGLNVSLAAGTREMSELRWDTLVMTTLVFAQAFRALALRAGRGAPAGLGLPANNPLAAAVLLVVALQLAVIYTPALNSLLGLAPLSAGELIAAIGAASLVLWVSELVGWLRSGGCGTGWGRARERAGNAKIGAREAV
jgi:Ca2+-transporting ATPase